MLFTRKKDRYLMNSIAMCTYNGEKYVREQLESIVAQTLQPDEIVICDDCSKDRTVEIVRETLKDWSGSWRLVCNEENLGFKKNFEKAISLCRGDIIYLSDQDDVWDIRKLEIVDEVFRSHPEAVAVWHDAELVDAKLQHLYLSFWRDTLKFNYKKFLRGDYSHVMDGNVMQGSACAFRRKVFEQAVPFPREAIHDEWLLLVALLLGEVIPVPKALMKYRQADNILGGVPVTVKERIKSWGKWNAKVQFLIGEIERRRFIFSEITSRKFSVVRHDVWEQYNRCGKFLSYRISCIKRKSCGLCLHFPEYRDCSCNTWRAVKVMVKDYLFML